MQQSIQAPRLKNLILNEGSASGSHLKKLRVDNPATIDLTMDEHTNRVRFFQNEDESSFQPAKTMEGWDQQNRSPGHSSDNRSIIKSKPLFIQINET